MRSLTGRAAMYKGGGGAGWIGTCVCLGAWAIGACPLGIMLGSVVLQADKINIAPSESKPALVFMFNLRFIFLSNWLNFMYI